MSNVDDRIVQMVFDNKTFEQGVKTTMGSLDNLKKSLDFSQSTKNLSDLNSAGSKFNLDGVANAADGISSHFSAMSIAGIAALASLVTKAVDSGIQIAKAFTVDPVKAGLENYETQINAIQTILANTSQKGTTLDQVNAALAELNTYANQTVYNFSEMTKNIGTFTAAGVDLDTSVNAIKGIANLAALSGSSSDQASTAMYQLSQAIAAGNVKLQDWNSVVNAGIGGQVFQKALYNTAVQFGTIKNAKVGETFEQWTNAGNSFRNSLQDGWLTSKVLTSTLSQFTGDMTDAQLAAQGFSKDQIAQIQQLGKTANASAVNIKTLTQLQQALKEEVATAYAAIFKTVFGDINQATALFSKMHTSIENALTNPIYALNTLLQGAVALGARDKAIDAFTNAIHAMGAVLKPIKDAFREIFPPETSQEIFQLVAGIDNLSKNLTVSSATADKIKRSFAGVFAIFDIGRQIVIGVITVIRTIFDQFAGGPTAVLGVTASFGDFLVKLDKTLVAGGKIQEFFSSFSNVANAVGSAIKGVAGAFENIFKSFKKDGPSIGNISDSFGRVADRFNPLVTIFDKVRESLGFLGKVFAKFGEIVHPIIQATVDGLDNFGKALAGAFANGNFSNVLDSINTGLLGGITLIVSRWLKKGFSGGVGFDLGGGILKNIGASFKQLTGVLQAMQTNIKADTLLKIAGAVALLTISIVALSLIDSDKLTKAMTGVGVAMGELVGAMALMEKVSTSTGFVKMPFIAAGLVIFALAIDLLVPAIVALGNLDWGQLTKGLLGLGGLMLELSVATKPLAANSAGMVSAGVGIVALALGLKVMVSVIKDIAALDTGTIYKGLVTIGAALLAIGAAANLFPEGMIAIGLGLIGISTGLKILASVIEELGGLDVKTLYTGIAAIAAALLAIGAAMNLFPVTTPIIALGLIGVAAALEIITKVITNLGNLGFNVIYKGLTTMGAALLILAAGLYLMDGAVSGALALLVTAGALAILVPELIALGNLSWTQIIHGLATLAGAFAVIGIAGLLLEPVVPGLLGLGLAILAIGGGVLLAAVGVTLLAAGLTALVAIGGGAISLMGAAIDEFVQKIPELVDAVGNGLLQAVVKIGDNAPAFVEAIVKLLTALLDGIDQMVPQIVLALTIIILNFLQGVRDTAPQIIATGLFLLTTFLQGIANNIGAVVTAVGQIIINFLNALAAQLPGIIAAGANLLVNFLQGIADHIGDAVGAGINIIVNLLNGIAAKIPDVVAAGANLLIKLLEGVAAQIPKIAGAATDVAIAFVQAMGQQAVRFANAAAQALVDFLNGLADAINRYAPQLRSAGENVAFAIIDGMTGGLASKAKNVANSAVNVAKGALSSVGSFLGIGSPSKEFMRLGEQSSTGMAIGIDNTASDVKSSAVGMATDALNAVSDTIAAAPIDLGVINASPVITPVLDLTNVTKDASQIPGLLSDGASLNVGSSIDTANTISADVQAQQDTAVTDGATTDTPPTVIFEQNNTSPKSLSTIEIYRNTKSQLQQAAEVLSA